MEHPATPEGDCGSLPSATPSHSWSACSTTNAHRAAAGVAGVRIALLGILLCAALAASWWFLGAGIPILVLLVASADDPLVSAAVGAILTAPVVFGVLAAAVAIGRKAQRRGSSSRVLASGMAACLVLALGVGILDAVRPPLDIHAENPLRVDWRRGSYEGIELRSSTAALIARLGQPSKRGIHESAEPIEEDYYDIGGPTSFGSAGRASEDETLRFKHRAFFATEGHIYGWVTTSDRAETPEGIGVGTPRT